MPWSFECFFRPDVSAHIFQSLQTLSSSTFLFSSPWCCCSFLFRLSSLARSSVFARADRFARSWLGVNFGLVGRSLLSFSFTPIVRCCSHRSLRKELVGLELRSGWVPLCFCFFFLLCFVFFYSLFSVRDKHKLTKWALAYGLHKLAAHSSSSKPGHRDVSVTIAFGRHSTISWPGHSDVSLTIGFQRQTCF